MDQLGEYFVDSVGLLDEHKWIYDFQMTELFSLPIMTQLFPRHWISSLKKCSYKQLYELVASNDFDRTYSGLVEQDVEFGLPESLKQLFKKVKCLERLGSLKDLTNQIKPVCMHSNISPGYSAKKKHEIQVMMPYIKEICLRNNCNYLIDIGSGLGYFDQFLADNSDIKVIGIERNEAFVNEAIKRQEKMGKKQIYNISYTIEEDSGKELMHLVKKHLIDEPDDVDKGFGLISLHSCGDLTPSMLKIFSQNECELKFMVAFSCCYHSMQPEGIDNSASHVLKTRFKNFPMSKCLRSVVDQHCPHFSLSLFGLRLGCQQNISAWKNRTDEEHRLHSNQLAYRALLQKYANDKNFKIKKLKRKLANKQEFENFYNYVQCVKEKIVFEDSQGSDIQIKDLSDELEIYHAEHEKYFDAIEPLCYLQLLLQPVIEQLILKDRIAYLIENNLSSSQLIKLFDNSISPRCICILSEK